MQAVGGADVQSAVQPHVSLMSACAVVNASESNRAAVAFAAEAKAVEE